METQKTICKINSEWRLKKIHVQFYLLHICRIVNEFIIVIDVYIGPIQKRFKSLQNTNSYDVTMNRVVQPFLRREQSCAYTAQCKTEHVVYSWRGLK